ncbi:protein TRC8 homolog isoform X3 [Aquila chrysaetos chrysaetos]|uniref:protein TRC8 homolog isoform X3 n=1 Tax=Aquila chrysaetos chrysaetos TaxID=223781 RepID=UPI001B7D2B78|nr:protein TRC8 homolog isoform X3 [Aquila chrysaetos chrysaetos]
MARLEAVANVALRVPGLALLDLLYRWDAAALGDLLRPRRGDPPPAPAPRPTGRLLPGPLAVPGGADAAGAVPGEALPPPPHCAAARRGAHGGRGLRPPRAGVWLPGRRVQRPRGARPLRHRPRRPALPVRPLLPPDEEQAALAVRRPAAAGAGSPLRPPPPRPARPRHLCRHPHCPGGALRPRLPRPRPLPAGRRRLPGGRAGAGGVPAGRAGGVPLEPAGHPAPLPRLLAGALLPPALLLPHLLQQSPGPAGPPLRPPQQRGRVLQHAVLPHRPHLHRLLPRPGRPQPLQVLPAGLWRLPERQRHAQILQRTFLLSIILFIVVTSTLQSMIEIADPIVLALGASRNRSPWKHFRGVSTCLFLLVFPCFMAYKIARFFHLDFWLLILVSSCMLTSLQVMGTLFIYTLFMVELLQDTPLERMDEIIYCVNAVSRVLEFLVAVCVVGYGTWESLFGEWSWMGASVIIIHSYFNVWLRAQSGWRSFLLRREAAKKINSLPRATGGQLRDHNDVCAICFQDMQVAVITPCSHFFHAACLRKWLYVQDTCPMCHQQVTPVAAEEDHGIGRAARPAPAGGDEVLEDGGAATNPALARPREDRLPGVDSVVSGQGDSGASQDHGAGDRSPHHPAHPDTSAPQEREAGAVPQPPGDPHPGVQDMQHLSPSPASPEAFASPELGARDSGDSHSGDRTS